MECSVERSKRTHCQTGRRSMSEPDDEIPADDFGNPLTTCTGCGQITQCARGLCWWCLVNECRDKEGSGEQ